MYWPHAYPSSSEYAFLWILLEVPETTSWPGKVSSLNLLTCPSSTMPLGLLMISRQERYFFVLVFFFFFFFFLWWYHKPDDKTFEFYSNPPRNYRENSVGSNRVRRETRKHFLTGFRIYGTIYQMSWGLPISVFLLLRNYALPSIMIRPLTLSALIPPGKKSAVS